MNNRILFGASVVTALAVGLVAGSGLQLHLDKKAVKKNATKVGELWTLYTDMIKYKSAAMHDESITREEYAAAMKEKQEFIDIVYNS